MTLEFKPLLAEEVEFSTTLEPECDEPFEGNCLASGDEAEDKKQEDWVRSELARGNEAAWCVVITRAKWGDVEAFASLGACSYESIDAALADVDMKEEALEQLNALLWEQFERLSSRHVPALTGEVIDRVARAIWKSGTGNATWNGSEESRAEALVLALSAHEVVVLGKEEYDALIKRKQPKEPHP